MRRGTLVVWLTTIARKNVLIFFLPQVPLVHQGRFRPDAGLPRSCVDYFN